MKKLLFEIGAGKLYAEYFKRFKNTGSEKVTGRPGAFC